MDDNMTQAVQVFISIFSIFIFYSLGYERGQCIEIERHNKYLRELIERWEIKYDRKNREFVSLVEELLE